MQLSARENPKQIKIRVERKTPIKQTIAHKDFQLAFFVRQLTYQKIIAFDAHKRFCFSEDQIKKFLSNVLKQNTNQTTSAVKSALLYDANADGLLEYDELVNFCLQQHLGEITLEKYQKEKFEQQMVHRMLNKDKFIQVIRLGLSFLDLKLNLAYLQDKFSLMDTDQDGLITFEQYFRFLKDYFGSNSYAAELVHKNSVLQVFNQKEPKTTRDTDIINKYTSLQHNSRTDSSNYIKQVDSVLKIMPETTHSQYNARSHSQTLNKLNFSYKSNLDNSPRTTINSINNHVNTTSIVQNLKASSHAQLQRKKKPAQNSKIQITLLQKNPFLKDNSKDSKLLIPLSPNQINLGQRIARMVFTQLRVSVIASDSNKDGLLSCEQMWNHLKQILQFDETNQLDIFKRNCMSRQMVYNLEDAMRLIMSEAIIKAFKQVDCDDINTRISIGQFSSIFQKVCTIVPYTPLPEKYHKLYQLRAQKKQNVTVFDAQAIIFYILASYTLKK